MSILLLLWLTFLPKNFANVNTALQVSHSMDAGSLG
jgi:hypothetical protein